MIRTFVSVPLPASLIEAVRHYQQPLAAFDSDVRWVSADNLHITLKFLGDVDESRVPGMSFALKAALASETSFSAAMEGSGTFPASGAPRVVWVGLSQGGSRLTRLAHRVDTALAGLGFPAESRPFRPHVTIGRVKTPRNIRPVLEALETDPFEGERFSVESVLLMKSVLTPAGPQYTVLNSFKLRG